MPRIDVTRRYSNGEVTIVWRSALCRHTGICFRGLPQVFDPRRRPWIIPTAASTDDIITQVRRCPSGALSLEEPVEPGSAAPDAGVRGDGR